MRILSRVGIFLTPAFVLFCGCGHNDVTAPSAQLIPNLNQQITPLAPYDSTFEPLVPGAAILPAYPDWQVGQAVSSVVSPDGNTLLILTSGFNRIYQPLGTRDGGYINGDNTAYAIRARKSMCSSTTSRRARLSRSRL